MKRQLLAGGALVALLTACGSDPVVYSEPYYVSSSAPVYYTDRYAYNRYVDTPRVASIEVLRSDGYATNGGAPIVIERQPRAIGTELYRVTIRNPSGHYETYVMESLGTVRVGDRVRVDNGRIYPIG